MHLALVIISLQVLGQVSFDFELSIAQILVSVLTCAVFEIAVTFWRRRMFVWPASALLTGNGIAFILRVPGTAHGDWWSLNGAWIFAATGVVSLLSKYLIRVRGRHLFNPSNFGLVVCFLVLGASRVEPLDFWWGPMSASMALALGIIVAGGLIILSRLRLLAVAVVFWLTFAAALGMLAITGHCITARWHVGPLCDRAFWTLLITSPEILVFLFFMITDPKTVPIGERSRRVYAVAVALVATLLIAPQRTEWGAKVALLGALALVCAARPLLEWLFPADGEPTRVLTWMPASRRARLAAVLAAAVTFTAALFAAGIHARSSNEASADVDGARPNATTSVPVVRVNNDRLSGQISLESARAIANDVAEDLHVQADALERHDRSLVAGAATGDLRAKLEQQIATGRTVTAPPSRVDEVIVSVARRKLQRAPAILATIRGTTDLGRGNERFAVTYEVKRVRGRFLLASDQPPPGWNPPP